VQRATTYQPLVKQGDTDKDIALQGKKYTNAFTKYDFAGTVEEIKAVCTLDDDSEE